MIECAEGSSLVNPVDHQFDYTFGNVQQDWTITVFFSADGEAYVPAGQNVPLYLGDSVSVIIESTEGGGTAFQYAIALDPELVGTSLILWQFSMGEVSYSGPLQVRLPLPGEDITNVY